MRLISQNKQVDVPYEHVFLLTDNEYIYVNSYLAGQQIVMAKYENYSALNQALHDLQFAYIAGDKYFCFP